MVDAPNRSLAQRMDALVRANTIRTRRASLKKDIKARRTNIIGLIIDPPGYIDTMKVLDLLLAVPKVGKVKANNIVRAVRVSPSKTVGGLSQRQRTELANYLRNPYSTRPLEPLA